MPLRFILGRSGTGKTSFCMDEVRARVQENPDGHPLVLLVPEQATFQTEYALAGAPGAAGTIRAQALSFRRLAYRVMQETGGTALVPIGENGKNMLLYKLVHRLSGELTLFRSGAGQHGFIERMNELLTELKRYGIDPPSLGTFAAESGLTAADGLIGSKLHDIRVLYEALEHALAGHYLDAEDSLAYLARGFASSSLTEADIWVDGFHGFTPAEYEALGALLKHARSVTVALCLDKPYQAGERPHDLDLFHPTAQTYIRLRELAEQSDVELLPDVLLAPAVSPRWSDSPMLAHLERHYGGRTPLLVPDRAAFEPEHPACGVTMLAAASRRAEVDAAARDIVRRVQEEGLRWRDFAVMVRSSADYTDYIETIFADYGIPYFLDQKEAALHHPLVELIRSALETVTMGWRYEAVFRCIKTEMLTGTDGRVTRGDLDRLENYVLAAGIDGWRWHDEGNWKPLVRDPLEDEPGSAQELEPERFPRLIACRDRIAAPLRSLETALKRAKTVREMCEALYALLDGIRAADRLEQWSREAQERGDIRRAREHRQLWDGVMGLLDQLVELAGGESMPIDLFAGMVETGLDSLRLGAVPPTVDRVLIGSVDRTRPSGTAVCYLLGANEGVLPKRIQEDGILTESERERLEDGGLKLAPGVRRRLLDERFMIYNVLTTPAKCLWISYSTADEEGKSLHPSEVIRQLKTLFPGLEARSESGEPDAGGSPGSHLRHIRRPDRTLALMAAQLRLWRQGEPVDELWRDVYNWFAARSEWADRLQTTAASLTYRNDERYLSRETARRLYGDHLRASVSRMEKFTACPFQHFAAYGLRLEERKLFRLDNPDVGQLFHAALSRLAETYGASLGGVPQEGIVQTVSRIVDELVPRLQSRILLSSSRYGYIARKLKQVVAQTALMLAEHARRGHFAPVGLEVGFGPEAQLPALTLPAGDGRFMDIVGRIDRVDAAETEDGLLLRIIDYKSSATALRLEDVMHGLTLQMLTYLDVLLTHAEGWLGKPAMPAGVLYFHVHNPLLASSGPLSAEDARKQLLKRFKTKGLLLAEEHVVRLMDGELETGYSELLPVALKKDGGFYGTSSAVSRGEWDVLRGAVRKTISRIGGRIMDGEVAIAPYKQGNRTPCGFCPYKPVCHFDPLMEGNAHVRLPKPPKERVWELLRESAAGGETVDRTAEHASSDPIRAALQAEGSGESGGAPNSGRAAASAEHGAASGRAANGIAANDRAANESAANDRAANGIDRTGEEA